MSLADPVRDFLAESCVSILGTGLMLAGRMIPVTAIGPVSRDVPVRDFLSA
jgi:hypothetical protein